MINLNIRFITEILEQNKEIIFKVEELFKALKRQFPIVSKIPQLSLFKGKL